MSTTASKSSTKTTAVWTKLLDKEINIPSTRSSHGLSVVSTKDGKDRLVLYGGEHIARTPIDIDESTFIMEQQEKEENVWQCRKLRSSSSSTKSSFPPCRVAHAQASIGGNVYIFGGRQGITMKENPLNDMWMLDAIDSETWTEIIPKDGGDGPPEARSFHRMISIGTNLFVFGGCGMNGRLADLHKFDTITKTWTNLGSSTLLRGRGGPNLIPIKWNDEDSSYGALAVVGGFCGEETNDGHRFSLSDYTWEQSTMDGLQNLRPRSVCVSGYLPSIQMPFLFGGEVDPSDRGHEGAGGFENDIILLDGITAAFKESIRCPEGEEGEEKGLWPETRGWSDGAVSSDGKSFYIFGGLSGDDENPKRLADLWRCEISLLK